MRITNLVQASADVVTIVNLKPGDVYKRLNKEYNSSYKAYYGVVQTVDNNGEDTLITVLEWDYDYNGVSIKSSVFGNDSDLKLFATTPDELQNHVYELISSQERLIATKERELANAVRIHTDLIDLAKKVERGEVTNAVTEGKVING